jgi:hypothetical protein
VKRMKTVAPWIAALALLIASPAIAQPAAGAFKATSPSLSTALVAVAAPGHKLQSFEVAADGTLSASVWYILIYDATADPGNGSVTPAKCYPQISGTTGANYAFATGGVNFYNGIVIVVSTTGCLTETQSAHAIISADWY